MAGNITFANGIYCFGLIILGIVLYVIMANKTKDKLNPFSLVCISWCFLGGIASLHLSWLETDWSIITYIVVLLFPVLVFSCGFFNKTGKMTNDKFQSIHFTNVFIMLTRMLFVISLICALLEWRGNGFLLALSSGAADAKSTFRSIPVIHYGTIYFPYCAINSIFELIYRKKKSLKTIAYLGSTILINLFYALFIGASRGSLLIIFCALVYLFFRKYSIPIRKIIIMIGAILIGFIAISKVRIFSGSLVYDVIHGYPLISSVYGYTALNFENLNKLIVRGPSYSIISYTYGGFLQLLGVDGFFPQPEYITTYFFNANTICYDFYEDLGLLGVFINTIILFGCIRILYKKSLVDRRYLLLIAVMQKAIWMTFFGNYFTIYRVMIFPFLVTGLVVYSMNLEIHSFRKIVIRKGAWKKT